MIITFIQIILIILFLFSFSATITLSYNFRLYKEIYNSLPLKTFYNYNNDQIYDYEFTRFMRRRNGFIWFTDKNDFKLKDGHYLNNSIITYFCPYSLYWYIKYYKWCKKNIKINELEKF